MVFLQCIVVRCFLQFFKEYFFLCSNLKLLIWKYLNSLYYKLISCYLILKFVFLAETSARRRLDVESNGNSRRFAREFVNTNENIPPKIFQSSINLATTEIDNNFHHTKSLENMTKNNYYNFRNFDAINSESLSAANQDKQCYNRNHFSQKSSPTPRCFHEVRTHCKKVNSTPPTKESMINGSVKRYIIYHFFSSFLKKNGFV